MYLSSKMRRDADKRQGVHAPVMARREIVILPAVTAGFETFPTASRRFLLQSAGKPHSGV